MTIHLPVDLESWIQASVHSGRFASVDEAMTEAARLLLKEFDRCPPGDASTYVNEADLGSIGAMREDAELLDQAVEHAMRVREERPWRLNSVE